MFLVYFQIYKKITNVLLSNIEIYLVKTSIGGKGKYTFSRNKLRPIFFCL
jgi:hypothetical protein